MQQPCNVIHLDPEAQEHFRRKSSTHTLSLSEDNMSLRIGYGYWKKSPQLVKLTCSYCGVYYNDRPSENKWLMSSNFDNCYCDCCFRYSSKRYYKGNLYNGDSIDTLHRCHGMVFDVLKKTVYKCKWPECKLYFYGASLKEHEISCELQLTRECPVDDCTWKGRLNEMQVEHFTICHSKSLLSFNNIVTTMSPRVNEYYLLILNKFVLVQYKREILGELYSHTISLKMCKDGLDCPEPMAVVSNVLVNDNALICEFQGDGAFKSIRSEIALFVSLPQPKP